VDLLTGERAAPATGAAVSWFFVLPQHWADAVPFELVAFIHAVNVLPPREQPVRRLLRIRNARIYLLGDVVSTLGDSALWLAMAIWLKELTGSSSRAGLVVFCYAIGGLASPAGGVIADRFRRRPLLIWSNLCGAVVVLGILLVHDRSQLWIVYLVIFCYGLVGSVIGPAQTALLPSLVPEDLLAEANAAQPTTSDTAAASCHGSRTSCAHRCASICTAAGW